MKGENHSQRAAQASPAGPMLFNVIYCDSERTQGDMGWDMFLRNENLGISVDMSGHPF